MDNTANREMVQDLSQGEFSSRLSLLDDFKKLSNFIVTQREDIVNLWGQDSAVKVVSFYETLPTPVVEKVSRFLFLRYLFILSFFSQRYWSQIKIPQI
jgi:hypothetical protein